MSGVYLSKDADQQEPFDCTIVLMLVKFICGGRMNKNRVNEITRDDVEGRRKSAAMLLRDRPRALEIARGIRHPWYRCQALTAVAEGESSPKICKSLLMEALSAAYEQAEPNRIVTVASWPLRHLSKLSPKDAEIITRRLQATIEAEPHGLRKLDGLSAILHAVMDSSELRARILPAFQKAASSSVGWRTERIVASAAEALAELDIQTARELIAGREPNKFSRRIQATLAMAR
jgi:hypothetical protein